MQDQKEAYEDQCKRRAYEYFKGQIAKVDSANLETELFSTGGRNTYCFVELLFDELGGKNRELDRRFFAMMRGEPNAGELFKEEFSRVLGDKYSEIGEIDSD